MSNQVMVEVEIVHPKIQRYLASLPSHGDAVLQAMEAQAEQEAFPIVGPQVGRLLMLLTRATGSRRVFEMGSGFGYSALWVANGLPDEGSSVTLTDTEASRLDQARRYFERARQAHKAVYLIGDAIELIRQSAGPFDIIFLDADKARYPAAFAAALPKLRPGGLFIADNVLWSGQVAASRPDRDTKGILEFTRLIYSTTGLCSCILPLRDGVSISMKAPA